MEFKKVDGLLTIFLAGRIDSHNADQTGVEIDKIIAENEAESVLFDAENLEYISSAGLRVVLRIRKARPELKIINVSSEVYEIFEMTGVTEMMTIEKAYRRVSVDGCEVIGQGANGKVYRLDPD
ncbi:MAG: STAS domain-containing protein, partial [Clostridia bacterium]|nr:STAS domain-containing protein [Clostridia bacterium]